MVTSRSPRYTAPVRAALVAMTIPATFGVPPGVTVGERFSAELVWKLIAVVKAGAPLCAVIRTLNAIAPTLVAEGMVRFTGACNTLPGEPEALLALNKEVVIAATTNVTLVLCGALVPVPVIVTE